MAFSSTKVRGIVASGRPVLDECKPVLDGGRHGGGDIDGARGEWVCCAGVRGTVGVGAGQGVSVVNHARKRSRFRILDRVCKVGNFCRYTICRRVGPFH